MVSKALNMIQVATIADLPLVQECAQEFYASSQFLKKFEIERFVTFWTGAIESGIGVIFLQMKDGAVNGCFGGVMFPDLYSGAVIATEFFWFVKEKCRGGGMKLYRAFESWAKEKGCAEIQMIHLLDLMPEKLEKVYRHLGFVPVETRYSKEVI